MDAVTFQPAAGAHGEFTGVLLIKAYHTDRGDFNRTKIIVPDSAHGTNPATAAMCGFQVINIPSAGADTALKWIAYVPMVLIVISIIFTAVPLSFDAETLASFLPITIGSILSVAIGEVLIALRGKNARS